MNQTKIVIAPKSAEAIKLALLASHNAALNEAEDDFHVATHMVRSADRLELGLVRPLVSSATVAYGRCFNKSFVDGSKQLQEMITLPEDCIPAHESLLRLRNSTIAHTESVLNPTFPLVHLRLDGPDEHVRAVAASAMTISPNFSVESVDAYWEHVKAVKHVLRPKLEEAMAALLAVLPADPGFGSLWEDGQQPKFVSISLDEWDIETRRADYPESNTIQVVVSPRQTFLAPFAAGEAEPAGDGGSAP